MVMVGWWVPPSDSTPWRTRTRVRLMSMTRACKTTTESGCQVLALGLLGDCGTTYRHKLAPKTIFLWMQLQGKDGRECDNLDEEDRACRCTCAMACRDETAGRSVRPPDADAHGFLGVVETGVNVAM